VEQLSTHGGSLRVYGCHEKHERAQDASVAHMLAQEQAQGLENLSTYQAFQTRADKVKNDLLAFLIEQKRAGKTVAAYGAAAKGNTLLNYAGVKPDLLPFVCDAAAAKQHKFMPASHIPIVPPEYMHAHQPDFVLILPWNIASEVRHQLSDLHQLGVRFVTAVPELHIDPVN
jgi:hypothetical protein